MSITRTRVQSMIPGDESPQVLSKYFCAATKNQIHLSIEIKSPVRTAVKNPLCFVLVIDASGSMGNPVGNESITLFDRMKTFAHMMIDSVSSDDYLAIVSFSGDARVDLGITKMNEHGKVLAKKTLPLLQTRGMTNLEAGLTQGLKEIFQARRLFWSEQNIRSSIILFTDGLPNEGIIDANGIVSKYKSFERTMEGQGCVPLSAFTIGDYRPDVLVEVASKLNNEAFYWLDESQDFESDMLIPFLLRKITHVSDVRVQLNTRNGISFCQEKISNDHLEHHTEDQRTYFLRSLPSDMPKTIQTKLALPRGVPLSMLHGQAILNVLISYLDENMRRVEILDVITFCQLTLHDIMERERIFADTETQTYAKSAYLFTSENSKTMDTWEEAKKSLLKIAQMDCRKHTVDLIQVAQNGNSNQVENLATKTLGIMSGIKFRFENIVGDDSVESKSLREYLSQLKVYIQISKLAVIQNGGCYSKLAALVSALKNETPGAGGVTGLKTGHAIDKKLDDYRKTLSDARTRLRRTTPSKGSHNYARLSEILDTLHGEQNGIQDGQDDNYTPWVFENAYFVLSGNFRDRREIENKIHNLGGRSGETITGNIGRKVFIVCATKNETKRNSRLILEAQQKNIPIVYETFVDECVKERELVSWFKFGL